MSSSTSDFSLNTITDFIANIQRKQIFTKQRFHSIREYFFQSIGFTILLYCLSHILILFYLLLKLIFSILFWLPLKTIQSVLPKTTHYGILFPLFWFCSIVSFSIARFSHENIGKRFQFCKRYSLVCTFIILFLLQVLFILVPIATSIREQQKLSSTVVIRVKLPEKEVIQTMVQNDSNKSISNGIQANKTVEKGNTNARNKVSNSLWKDSPFKSDVEDDSSNLIEQVKQTANSLIDSAQEFSSQVLEKTEQNNKIRRNVVIEKQKRSTGESEIGKEETGPFKQKFHSWLDEAWNIWHQTKLDFQQLFSLSMKDTEHLPIYNVSSIYTAYTDLNCYNYTKTKHRYHLTEKTNIYFLNTYRHHSPFPVYLSILKSNGPRCYRHYPDSSCAITSESFFPNFKRQLYLLSRLSVIVSILILLSVLIYKVFQHQQNKNKSNRSSNTNTQITSDKTNNLVSQQTSSTINNNNHPLDENIEKQFRLWLEREQNDGYQNISEACRTALNEIFSKKDKRFFNEFIDSLNQQFSNKKEQLTIEALLFTNAKIYNVSQSSVEKIIIDAVLELDQLTFDITKDQHYAIKIPKLIGELQILLIDNTDQYTIEVKLKQIQIDHAELIDSKNILSADEKQSIMKLFKETISQTVVQCCFYLSDNQENVITQLKSQPSNPSILSQSSYIYEPCETPPVTPVNDNNERTLPENEGNKTILVRIVKAVKLHNVEQPFCILELNQPKQTHQTSLAKDGLNPIWNEQFLFECNDKSNQIRLQIIDRKKANKKLNTTNIDKIHADIAIPFSYATSTIYKQDMRITPEHPDSIIRVEFSTLSDEEALAANNGCDTDSITNRPERRKIEQQARTDQILVLSDNEDALPNGYENNASV